MRWPLIWGDISKAWEGRLMSNSEKQVVVLTGGAGVLCSAIAKGLAQGGITVVLLDLALDKAEAVAEAIRSAGGTAIQR